MTPPYEGCGANLIDKLQFTFYSPVVTSLTVFAMALNAL